MQSLTWPRGHQGNGRHGKSSTLPPSWASVSGLQLHTHTCVCVYRLRDTPMHAVTNTHTYSAAVSVCPCDMTLIIGGIWWLFARGSTNSSSNLFYSVNRLFRCFCIKIFDSWQPLSVITFTIGRPKRNSHILKFLLGINTLLWMYKIKKRLHAAHTGFDAKIRACTHLTCDMTSVLQHCQTCDSSVPHHKQISNMLMLMSRQGKREGM